LLRFAACGASLHSAPCRPCASSIRHRGRGRSCAASTRPSAPRPDACSRRLTGECYISSESFWVDSEPWYPRVGRRAQHRFSVTVHCLEHADGTVGEDRDYLGLEVHFEWRPDLGDFVFDGDVDSRSI
jgi:hypothetical protein